MKRQHTVLAGVIATAGGVLVPCSAGATLSLTTSTVSFTNSASVTDAEGGSATTTNGASLGSTSLSQFDAATGVLMGATINVTSSSTASTQTQSVQVTSTAGGGTGANFDVTSNGSGSSTSYLSAPGVSATTFSSLNGTDSCVDKWKNACSGSATSSTVNYANLSLAVNSASLDSYVGAGTVSVARTADLTAQQLSSVFSGTESTTYSLTWNGTLSATYDYLLHAAPSFDDGSTLLTLNLDFGTVYLGDSASLGFGLYNLDDPNRVGLDLDAFSETSDPGNKFSTNLATFAGLDEGTGSLFTAFFDTSSLGTFSGGYTLTLSDEDVGAAGSRYGYTLYLNLTGTVVQGTGPDPDPESVPEPGALALVGIGLLGLALGRRRFR